ncbi:MAG TPA: hypothetical protein VM121_03155 [Acidimicrobiales bacterium]|nr:hypothetical protein [Acidimicrobiales bacterium]
MPPERTESNATGEPVPDELAEEQAEKDAQVLQREPLETELMDNDESGAGEEVDRVEDTSEQQ